MSSIENISGVTPNVQINTDEKKQQKTQPKEEKKVEIPQDLIDLTKEFSKDVPAKPVRFDENDNPNTPDPNKYKNLTINYEHLKLDRNGVKDTVGGISIGKGTQICALTNYLKLSAEVNGHLVGSGSSLGLQAGAAVKTYLGTELNVEGIHLPIGTYIKGGPAVNLTNIKGDTSAGIGTSWAIGVNLAGLNFEATKDIGTNYDSYGFRMGVSINF